MTNELMTAALKYAEEGWKVIPIWWVEEGPGDAKICACGNLYCSAPGKHPLIKAGRGLAEASDDPKQVREWWGRWPDANIAVACGRASGFFVIDCDLGDDEDGEVNFMQWCASHGVDIPTTMVQATGSGGRHILLGYPTDGMTVKNVTSWQEKVDVKSDGGYILVAPSSHVSGGEYRWLHAKGVGIAPAPALLVARLQEARSRPGGHGANGADQPVYDYRQAKREGPRAGYRDHFFNSFAFELRKGGFAWDDAIGVLKSCWEKTEQTPNDYFPWETVADKARRVWDEVEPDPLPGWDPLAAGRDGVRLAITANDPVSDSYTDQGNARRLLDLFGEDIRYTTGGGWMVWDGVRWVPDALQVIWELAGKTIDHMCQEAYKIQDLEKREALLGWAQQSRSRRAIEAMVKLTNTFPDAKKDITEFDTDNFLLCVANGTVDLRTGELLPHRREDFITKMSPVAYHADAQDDRWEKYLWTATAGDEELIAYLQRAAGYTLTGSTEEEALFMLYGPTASGKSTFISAVQTAMGDYSMTTMPENLMHRRGNSAPKDELAAMRGMRLVASTEPTQGDRWAEGLIKQMTGGDKVAARHLYKDRFEYTPTYKLWIAANDAPRARDHAFFRRMRRIPFPTKLEPHQRDLTLKSRWLMDPTTPGAQAVLKWMVDGAMAWRAELEQTHSSGLGTCAVVEADTEEYKTKEDTLGMFLDEVMEVTESMEDTVAGKELWDAFKYWCTENDEKIWMGRNRFYDTLQHEPYNLFNVAPHGRGALFAYRKLRVSEQTWAEHVSKL